MNSVFLSGVGVLFLQQIFTLKQGNRPGLVKYFSTEGNNLVGSLNSCTFPRLFHYWDMSGTEPLW